MPRRMKRPGISRKTRRTIKRKIRRDTKRTSRRTIKRKRKNVKRKVNKQKLRPRKSKLKRSNLRGGTQYRIGELVYYIPTEWPLERHLYPAQIVQVGQQVGDEYITIKLPDGNERNTTTDKIIRRPGMFAPWPEISSGAAVRFLLKQGEELAAKLRKCQSVKRQLGKHIQRCWSALRISDMHARSWAELSPEEQQRAIWARARARAEDSRRPVASSDDFHPGMDSDSDGGERVQCAQQ